MPAEKHVDCWLCQTFLSECLEGWWLNMSFRVQRQRWQKTRVKLRGLGPRSWSRHVKPCSDLGGWRSCAKVEAVPYFGVCGFMQSRTCEKSGPGWLGNHWAGGAESLKFQVLQVEFPKSQISHDISIVLWCNLFRSSPRYCLHR